MAKAATWTGIDAEVRKRGEHTGLDTLVVRTVNDVHWMSGKDPGCRSTRDKCTAWGVCPQGCNSKELPGARTSGGVCGLIRRNAKNLTKA